MSSPWIELLHIRYSGHQAGSAAEVDTETSADDAQEGP